MGLLRAENQDTFKFSNDPVTNVKDPPKLGSNMKLQSSTMNDKEFQAPMMPLEPAPLFYAVHIPIEVQSEKRENYVYSDRSEALRFLKQNKRARFKAFSNKADAIYFSQHGCTLPIQSNKDNALAISVQPASNQLEKSLFKSPKTQELIKFRKLIETDDLTEVKSLVEENPRYLISNGDTPSILQEGPRYNALHVAARSNSSNCASYILGIISCSELTNRVYGTQYKGINADGRAKILLDLYLNTPDKGANETPLHFASKHGSLPVVKVLLSYPECERSKRNKHGATAAEIICSRAVGNFRDNDKAIASLLEQNIYIPVLRSSDNSIQPLIGSPITLSSNLDPVTYIDESPVSPKIEVHALAGPMSAEKALLFQKMWKSPNPSSLQSEKPDCFMRPSLFDLDKGLERIGRKLACEYQVEWTEYWAFLDRFVDLESKEGLDMLEEFLRNKFLNGVESIEPEENKSTSGRDICRGDSLNITHNDDERSLNTTPVSNLCYKFRGLCLEDVSATSTETLGVPMMCFEKFLEMFAKRFASILRRSTQITHEISRLETFLTSCSNDKRFDSIDLSKAHYRLSKLVESNIRSVNDEEELITKCYKLLKSDNCPDEYNQEDQELIRKSTSCIISFILDHLRSRSTNSDSKSWFQSKSCDCTILLSKKKKKISAKEKRSLCKKKLDFPPEIVESLLEGSSSSEDDVECNTYEDPYFNEVLLQDKITNGSDSEEEIFFTPPSSPVKLDRLDEEFFDFNPSASDVFLAGDKPTKLDAAVLLAISNVEITSSKYPFIFYWQQSCENESRKSPKERWRTPKMKLTCNPTHRKLIRECISPAWHSSH